MSKYSLEVVLTSKSKPVKTYLHEGRTYIEGRKNSEYVLRFKNNSAERVLAVVSVDGLSVMDGKPASERSSGYVVGPWGTLDVPGWRIDNSKVASFKFAPQGDYDKTYVEELRAEGFNVDTNNQGVIGVMVFPEKVVYHHTTAFHPGYYRIDNGWGGNYSALRSVTIGASSAPDTTVRSFTASASAAAMPQNSMMHPGVATMDWYDVSSAPAVADAGLGTQWGEQKTSHVTTVSFERASTSPAFVHVITYDTLTGLRRRGVPVDEIDRNPVSSAFPASSLNTGCYVPSSKRR